MKEPNTCGVVRGTATDDPCCRTELHRGKHRGKRGTWALTAEERSNRPAPQRYLPPHRRPEGQAVRTGRYKRP